MAYIHPHPIRGVIFDIDGTLAMMDKKTGTFTALPGATEALLQCKDMGLDVIAYTNGTFFPPAHYYPLMADAGLNFSPERILTPANVAAHHLADQGYRRVMVLGGPGTTVPMQDAGFEVLEPKMPQSSVEAVLIGWTREFGVPELEAICEAVWQGAVPFTVSNAPFFASAEGRIIGVSGAIAAMIEQVTGKIPEVLGKPSTLGMGLASKLMGLQPEQIAVIGDDPKLEIAMARKTGSLAVGVTTGVADVEDFQQVPSDIQAQSVLSSLTELSNQNWFNKP